MLHMQHHFLCNIGYVVIAESMGKSLKYTTIKSWERGAGDEAMVCTSPVRTRTRI